MDFYKTSVGISKTIRNAGRLKEIVIVFARHGFDEIISLPITSKIPNFVIPKSKIKIREELKGQQGKNLYGTLGSRLRQCFEELGPTFIKFGQLLGSREDLFHPAFIAEMNKLRDNVKGVPFSKVKSEVENSYGKKISEIFKNVESKPLGTASIGIVYQGELLDGSKVVLKVRRPNIKKEVKRDLSLMQFLAEQVEKRIDEVKYLGISRIFKDFSISLQNELNFNVEGINGERLRTVINKYDKDKIFYIPKIYRELSSEDILVMELIEGTRFTNKENFEELKKKVKPKIEMVVQIFLRTLLQDGFFHADLHGGNFFLTKDNKIALIDFGLMGRLGYKARINFISIVHSIITYNYENIVFEFLEVAEYDSIPDVDKLVADVRDALSPFIGLTIQETDLSRVLKAIVQTLHTHKLYLPREWIIVFRALMTLDGVGRSLGIDLDLYSMMEKDIKNIIKESFNKEKIMEEALLTVKDLFQSSRIFPRHIKWFLKEWSKRKYAFEIIHTGHENSMERVTTGIIFLGFAIISAVFFASGVFFLGSTVVNAIGDIPAMSWVFWALGIVVFLLGMKKIR
jgi:ubiquinone biosynthesis protein